MRDESICLFVGVSPSLGIRCIVSAESAARDANGGDFLCRDYTTF